MQTVKSLQNDKVQTRKKKMAMTRLWAKPLLIFFQSLKFFLLISPPFLKRWGKILNSNMTQLCHYNQRTNLALSILQ